jgi:hypothetical protein
MGTEKSKAEMEYEFARDSYLSDTTEVRKDVTSFALAIIAATWVLKDKRLEPVSLWTEMAFLSAVAAIGINVLGKIMRMHHWMAIMRDDSIEIDFKATKYGWMAQISWYVSIAAILAALIAFIGSIFK